MIRTGLSISLALLTFVALACGSERSPFTEPATARVVTPKKPATRPTVRPTTQP